MIIINKDLVGQKFTDERGLDIVIVGVALNTKWGDQMAVETEHPYGLRLLMLDSEYDVECVKGWVKK